MLTSNFAKQQDAQGVLVPRRASQAAEQVAEFAAQCSCFEPLSSSSSSNWTAQVESSSSAIWLPDALRGERASRAVGAGQSRLSRRPIGQRSRAMQQGHHADTSRGGCRAVAVEIEAHLIHAHAACQLFFARSCVRISQTQRRTI